MSRKIKKIHSKKILFNRALLTFLIFTTIFFGIFEFNNVLINNQTKNIELHNTNNILSPTPTIKKDVEIRIPILLYHYVENVKDPKDTIRQSLNIQPFIFDLQVKTLKESGYEFLTASEIKYYLNKYKFIPERNVILIFDDGYEDFYEYVFPIIKKYNIKVTLYMPSQFINKKNYLTYKQLLEIKNSGLVEIGAHSRFHTYLKGLSKTEVKSEVEGSKSELEKLLGIKVTSFAYPYGAYDQFSEESVELAGFETAVTTNPGANINSGNLYKINRIRPGRRTGPDLIEYISQKEFKSAF